VAHATVPKLEVFSTPGALNPTQSFVNPWLLNEDPALPVPLVLLVVERRGDFVQVQLPIRPNGTVSPKESLILAESAPAGP
jgi:hypothetical protein